jgi:hypothetical protein
MLCRICTVHCADRLWPKSRTTTTQTWEPYYDEKGLYHSHSPNLVTTTYECSNGHVYEDSVLPMCPVQTCPYGREPTAVPY